MKKVLNILKMTKIFKVRSLLASLHTNGMQASTLSFKFGIVRPLQALFRQLPEKFKEGFVKFMSSGNGVGKHKYTFAVYKLHLIF